MATAKPIILKRFNGTDYDPLYPKTLGTQVFDSTGTTPLLSGDKIQDTFLPSYVFGGMRLGGTYALNGSTATTLQTIFGSWTDGTQSKEENGLYYVVTTGGLLDTDSTLAGGNVYKLRNTASSDEGQSGDPITVEAGDWIVYTGYEADVPSAGLFTFYFAIVNNTYRLATTSVDGIMSSSDKTKLDGIAANANNYVHPSYTTRSIDTTGVDVLDTFTSDSTGHVTGIATRTLPDATTSTAGVMSAADKTKLDGIASGANLYVLPLAAAGTRGGVQLGYASTETNRALLLSSEAGYVTLPRQIPAVTLNNTSTNTPSFYAPTGGGLAASTTQRRQYLQASGNGTAPAWVDAPRMLYEDTEAAATATGTTLGDIVFEY